jgi:hypothetical protein
LSSPKIISHLKASVNLEVRIFTTYGTSYKGTVKEVSNDDIELIDVKVCDTRKVNPGTFYYPRIAIIIVNDIAVVEGGYFDDGVDMSWLDRG